MLMDEMLYNHLDTIHKKENVRTFEPLHKVEASL